MQTNIQIRFTLLSVRTFADVYGTFSLIQQPALVAKQRDDAILVVWESSNRWGTNIFHSRLYEHHLGCFLMHKRSFLKNNNPP